MSTRAEIQDMATRMFNETFGDFKDPVVLTELGEPSYSTQTAPIINTDNTFGIRSEYDKSQFDGKKVQIGDYKILVLQQGLTVDVRADNVNMTFNGAAVSIESVSEDAARALYIIQARDK